MALFRKIMRGSENRSAQQKTQRVQREALRKREDPVLYQVKMKLKNHQDQEYSGMSDREMTKEAIRLTDHEALKEFFKDLTHQSMDSIMEEVATESARSDISYETVRQKHLDRVGQLTLKLHLSHLEETPSHLARLGAALFKIPYGMLRAALEIGDTSNPYISYMVEFNDSSLVQPRKKSILENSALEATIPLGGSRIVDKVSWPQPPSHAEVKLREKISNQRTGIGLVDSYYCSKYVSIRPRSMCVATKTRRLKKTASASDLTNFAAEVASSLPPPTTNQCSRSYSPPQSLEVASPSPSDSESANTSSEEFRPKPQARNQPIAMLQQSLASGEDLAPFVQMSLSKILLVEKLVKIIIKYNKCYYYHTVTRNCQTFVTEVLQSFGVWENFTLGERLEVYLANINKGRQEVYKCHKSVNDRVKYLIISGEIEETTYDEVRYLRSLYTIFHAEEFQVSARPITAVCSEPDCMLHALEDNLKKKRPDGATRLLPPENYI